MHRMLSDCLGVFQSRALESCDETIRVKFVSAIMEL